MYAQSSFIDIVVEPSQIQLDVAPVNLESQPPSNLQIDTQISTPSYESSENIELIFSDSIPHSPSLQFEVEPPIKTGAQIISNLLEH